MKMTISVSVLAAVLYITAPPTARSCEADTAAAEQQPYHGIGGLTDEQRKEFHRVPDIEAGVLASVNLSSDEKLLASNLWRTGTLVSLTADSLYLHEQNKEISRGWLRSDINRFRVSGEKTRHCGSGILMGAILGIPVGLGLASLMPKPTGFMEFVSSEQATGFVGGFLGSVILGGIFGSQIRTPVWHEVDLNGVPPFPDSADTSKGSPR